MNDASNGFAIITSRPGKVARFTIPDCMIG